MANVSSREEVYAALDSERDYQEMRKHRDSGADWHSVEEYLLYMESYLNEAREISARTWGPDAEIATLNVIRKVTALGVACMEQNGAPQREGFRRVANGKQPFSGSSPSLVGDGEDD